MMLSLLLLPLLLTPTVPVQEDPADEARAFSELVEQTARRVNAGRELEGYRGLREGLAALLAGATFADPRAEGHAEVAALLLETLAVDLSLESELADAPASPPDLPAAVAFRLERARLRGLHVAGRIEEAAALRDRLGYLTDLQLVGPFDNERGVGLSTAYPPEQGVDLTAIHAGKEREVRWRRVPVEPLDGRIQLDGLLRPTEQAVAYLATALWTAEARPVVLRIGSSSPVHVFHAGQAVFTSNAERPLGDDQDRVVLDLAAGWNTVLVKSGVEEGDWSLVLRLTDLGGRPLAVGSGELRVDSARSGQQDGPPPGGIALPAGEARDLLAAAGDDAAAWRDLARWLLIVHPHDQGSDVAERAARRAVELDPDHVEGRYVLAESLFPRGRSRAEMALGPYLAELDGVLERDGDHLAALLSRTRFHTQFLPMPDRVDELTRRMVELAPESWRALGARAGHLEERGREVEARLLRERAAARPALAASPDARMVRVRAERRAGRPEAALALLEEAVAQRPSDGPLVRELLRELAVRGRGEDLVRVLDLHLACRPFALARRVDGAALLEGVAAAGRPDALEDLPAAALRWLEEAHELCPEDREVLAWLARVELRRGDADAARGHLERILVLEPGNDLVRRQVEWLSSEPGEERFEDPWRRDAADLVGLPLGDGTGNDPLEVLDRTTVYRVHADGGESRYEHVVWRALNQAGVNALDRYGLVYPRGAGLHVYTVRVLRTDGSVERAPAPEGRDLLRGELALRPFDLPNLSVGDVVDVEYRVDETTPDVFGEYFGTAHSFHPDRLDALAPTRRSELVVISPPELPIHAHERNAAGLERSRAVDAAGNVVQTWLARDLERPAMESGMPGPAELAPVVELSTYPDWQSFARWWWSFIEKEFDTSQSMRDKVAELTEGLEDEDAKVAAIYRFVAQEIRYNAWPFGTHGYEPFSATTIFERRFGDCKDKSILLRQMLAEIGVEAVPVLIQAERFRGEEDLSLARVGHFNHCIAFVTPTEARAGYYLDATADRNPIEYLRFDDQGARVLHVTPEGGELHEIPYAPPEANALRRTWDVELDAAGGAAVELRDESTGQYAVSLRHRYGGERGDVAELLAQELDRSFGAVRVQDIETSDLDRVDEPAWLEARFAAQEVGTREAGGLSLELSFQELGLDGIAVEPADDRVHDMVFDRPLRNESLVRYLLPEGTEVTRVPPDVDLEAPGLLRYRLRVRREGRELEVERVFELLVQRVPREDYGAFREALAEVRLAEARTVGLAGPREESEEGAREGGER